ncbi:hypothetical protein Tco_0813783 [Tanacetum coccineum]
MHTRASNSELVEPLPEPERTLNQRLSRRNRKVPFERRNKPPKYLKVVYIPIIDLNYFRHSLDILQNYDPMDDNQSLFDRILGEIQAFSQHENETITDAWLCMKEMLSNCHGHNLSKGNIIKTFYHGIKETTQEALNAAPGGIFLYKTSNQAYQLLEDKFLLKLDWAKNQKSNLSLKRTVAFADEGISNSDIKKIMARMDAMTMKMDAKYKELKSRPKTTNPDHNDDDTPMSHEEEAKFMHTFRRIRFYNDYRDRDSNRDN